MKKLFSKLPLLGILCGLFLTYDLYNTYSIYHDVFVQWPNLKDYILGDGLGRISYYWMIPSLIGICLLTAFLITKITNFSIAGLVLFTLGRLLYIDQFEFSLVECLFPLLAAALALAIHIAPQTLAKAKFIPGVIYLVHFFYVYLTGDHSTLSHLSNLFADFLYIIFFISICVQDSPLQSPEDRNIHTELKKLSSLHDQGILSDEEYAKLKAKFLEEV